MTAYAMQESANDMGDAPDRWVIQGADVPPIYGPNKGRPRHSKTILKVPRPVSGSHQGCPPNLEIISQVVFVPLGRRKGSS